jgi:hypothetical protein
MDIDNKLKENIKEEISFLPKEMHDVIDNFELGKILTEIGKNHKFSDDEIITLQTETVLVLIGLVNPELYAKNIENNIGTSEQEAKKIENETIKKIFEPIYEKVVEKIKQNTKYEKQNWKKSINFILSGGDYSYFIEK